MKKKLVGAMLIGVLSMAGFAAALNSQNSQNQSGKNQINNQIQMKDGQGRGMKEGKGFGMFQELNLTDAQREEIRKIMDEERTQRQTNRESFINLTMAEREKQMQASKDELDSKIRKILTTEQQKIFDAKKLEQKQQIEAAKKEFNLTAEQQKKLDSIHAKYDAEFQKIQNDKLTEQERKDKMGTLRENMKNEMDSVFTDNQKKLLQEGKGFGPGLGIGIGRGDMGMGKGFDNGMKCDGMGKGPGQPQPSGQNK